MASFIELIAKIKQKNNGTFKLVDAQDVECEDGKGLDEALNEKLDKNLGAENINKVLVTDAEGNVVTQDKEDFEGGGTTDYNSLTNKPSINGVELSSNKTSSDLKMYTQEEVNYLLDDKMDKPYFDVAITDDTTIENTLAGNFKIDSIEGNIYQAEESGIVPTPERPIPIRSKKITVDGEIIELRSLKESKNIWDNTNIADYDGEAIVLKNWDRAITNLETSFIELKPNTKYTVKMDIEMVEAITDDTLTQFSLNKRLMLFRSSTNEFGLPTVGTVLGSYDSAMSNGETQSISATITTPEDLRGVSILGYTERWLDDNNKAYYAKVKFKNIMLVEGDSAPSSYVAPTVRDYKIVDHTNKTSKIVRNVLVAKGNEITSMEVGDISSSSTTKRWTKGFTILPANDTELSNIFNCVGYYKTSTEGFGVSANLLGLLLDKEKYTSFEQVKELIKDGEFYLKMAKSTEESIPYLEDDTSEVGLSLQDTISPSPDIESKIYEVDEINIKLVGKNLIDYLNNPYKLTFAQLINEDTFSMYENGAYGLVKYQIQNDNLLNKKLKAYCEYTGSITIVIAGIDKEGQNLSKGFSVVNETIIDTSIYENITEISVMVVSKDGVIGTFKNLMIYEDGIEVTSYEPYQEISIQHALSKPLRATKDGSVRDIIDIVNMQTIYNMSEKVVLDGSHDEVWDVYAFKKGFSLYVPNFKGGKLLKGWCDKFNVKTSLDETTGIGMGLNNNYLYVMYVNDIATTVEEWRVWLSQNPITVVYPLATPTTEPLEPELQNKLKTLKTFSPVTHVFVEGIAKPKLNAKYPKDIASAQAQLEQKVITLQEAVIKNV